MMQNIDNILFWKNSLGLLPLKQFSGNRHQDKYILLNGIKGNLCLDIAPSNDTKDFYFSSAWSSNIKNFVVAEKENVVVYNWKSKDVKKYSSNQVINNLVKFHNYIIDTSRRSEDDIIPFVIGLFRRLRNLYNDKSNPLDSLNQLFLLLSSLEESHFENSLWGIDDDVKPHPELIKYIEEFKKGVSGNTPDIDLVFRHSLGSVFQEAQKEVLFFDKQMSLFSSGTLSDIYQTRKILYSSVHHTPSYLARCIVENVLNEIDLINKKSLKILDPSCGSSEFLVEVLKQLTSKNYNGNVIVCGWDNSATAIKTSRFLLSYEKRIWKNKMDFSLKLVSDSLIEKWDNDFDIILMNPPFVSWEQLNKESRDNVSVSLERVFDGKPNQASAFFYKAIHSLNPDGVIGTVIPSSILMLDAYKKLRNEIQDISSIKLVGKLGNYVFEDALVDVSIFIASKSKTNNPPLVIWTNNDKGIAGEALSDFRKMRYSNSPSVEKDNYSIYYPTYKLIDSWKPISASENILLNKLNILINTDRLVRVEDIFNVQQGIRTGNNQVFKLSFSEFEKLPKEEKKYFKPVIDNESVKNGIILKQNYVWYPYNDYGLTIKTEEELEKKVSFFYNTVLKKFKTDLLKRPSIAEWWSLTRPRNWQFKQKSIICSTEFGKSDSFAFDSKSEFVIERGNGWLPKGNKDFKDFNDNYFYLAIFTSSFFDKMLSIYSKQLAGGNWFDLGKKFTKEIPIPKISNMIIENEEPFILTRESTIYKKMVQYGKDISIGEFYNSNDRDNLIKEFLYPIL